MMMQQNFPNYLPTADGKKIFYNTNFDPQKISSSANINTELPLLVFNYGLVCSNIHWSKQIPFFDKKGYPILLHNYRGHYNSSGQDDLGSCTFANFVSDLRTLLKKISRFPVIMLGHSMGVNITLQFAKETPELLQGMVLISGTVISPQKTMFDSEIMTWLFPPTKMLAQKYPQFFAKIWQSTPFIPLVQHLIRDGGFNPSQVPMEFIQQYLNRISQLPPQLFFHLFEGMGEHGIKPDLKNIHVPALIIGGEKDKVVPNHFQEILQNNLPNSQFYLVKDGSHVPQVDFPDLINDRILAFINKSKKPA